MKRSLLTLILMLLSLGAWAQYAGTGTVTRTGARLKVDGVKLSPEDQAVLLADINGTDYNPAWDKAKAGRSAGMALTLGGGVTALGGCTVLMLGLTTSIFGAAIGATVGSIGGQESAQQAAQQGADAGQPYITAGLVAAGLGVAAMGAGIPVLVVNSRKLNGIVKDCNSGRPAAQLTMGPTASGFGLALQF
jgi:hypothetical protein